MNWRADSEKKWRELSARLQAEPPDPALRILVLAAHPDDETIGASVLLSRFPESCVAFLTDGAPRDTKLWSAGVNGSREHYAETRRREAICALDCAGISRERICWLGGVDQEAVFEIKPLAETFASLISKTPPAVVITHSYEGGHPDHDSAAVVARLALRELDEDEEDPPALLEMTSYHALDGKCVTAEFLNPGLTPELLFELSGDDRERKRRMMNAYASQRLVLESFSVDRERLRLAPEYDFSTPPHEGKLWYECMRWAMTGERWRELASSAVSEFQEHACR